MSPRASRLSVSSTAAGPVAALGMARQSDAAEEGSCQAASTSATDTTPEPAEEQEQEHSGLSPLQALCAAGAGIAAGGAAAAAAIKHKLSSKPDTQEPEAPATAAEPVATAEAPGSGAAAAAAADEPPATYTPAAFEQMPSGGAAAEPPSLSSASGVASAAKDAVALTHPSGAAPATEVGPPPGIGKKGDTSIHLPQGCGTNLVFLTGRKVYLIHPHIAIPMTAALKRHAMRSLPPDCTQAER